MILEPRKIKFDFPGGSDGKACAYNAGHPGSISGSEDILEKGMATHSSILAPLPKKGLKEIWWLRYPYKYKNHLETRHIFSDH